MLGTSPLSSTPLSSPGGVAYTLACGSGSLSINGQAAGFNFNRVLNAAQGSLAINGQNVTLSTNTQRVLPCDHGSISITGQAVNLFRGYKLPAAQGSIAINGQNVGLKFDRRLTAAFGSLTINGQALGLHYNRILHCVYGSLSITGFAQSFLVLINTSAAFNGSTTFLAFPDINAAETPGLNFIIDLLPSSATAQVRELAARLTVDGDNIPIRDFSHSRYRGRIDDQVQITLADIADKDAIMRDAAITFETGEKLSSVWTWTKLIDSGYSNTSNYRIEQKGDVFSFVGLSPLHQRLNKTAEKDWVIFDPLRVTYTAGDFEIIYDSDGRSYTTTLTSVSGLRLYDLLTLLFVNVAGFSAVKTNIPNFRITSLNLKAGRPLIEAIAAEIGMYKPDFEDIGGTLWIRDTTWRHPSGWPAPQEVPISRAKQIGIDTEYSRVDAIELQYTEYRDNYDYVTQRTPAPNVAVADNNGQQITTTTTTVYLDYFRLSNPNRPVKTEKARVHTIVQDAAGWVFEDSMEYFYYALSDSSYFNKGDLGWRTKTINKKIPVLTGDHLPVLQKVETEDERFYWRGHPLELDKKFRYRKLMLVRGLIAVDTVNQQLDQDYKKKLVEVYRAGNLTEDMDIEEGPIQTFDEWVTPVTIDDVFIQNQEIDHLAKLTTTSYGEERVGDVGRSSFVNVSKIMYVFETDTSLRTAERIEPLNAGQLPPTFGIALARRELSNLKLRSKRMGLDVAGFDNFLNKGVPVAPTGRAAASLNVFDIDEIVTSGNSQGYQTQIRGTQSDDSGDPVVPTLVPGGTAYFSIASGQQKVLPIQVPCQTGFFLRGDVVAGLTVEARKQGDVSWINIETTPIDLSADDGDTVTYELRLTAGTITVRSRIQLPVTVGP